MKHFATNAVESLVIGARPGVSIRLAAAQSLCDAIGLGSVFPSEDIAVYHIQNFVFDGERNAASILSQNLLPAEFTAIRKARQWYRAIHEQFMYCSRDRWTRCGDFTYCNLNSGKCVVFVDAHYWLN